MNKDEHTPVISNSLSARVLFPWSMCAIMEKFLILSTGNLERSMDSLKKRKLICYFNVCFTFTFECLSRKNSSKNKDPPIFDPKCDQMFKKCVMYLLNNAALKALQGRHLGLCADHPAAAGPHR